MLGMTFSLSGMGKATRVQHFPSTNVPSRIAASSSPQATTCHSEHQRESVKRGRKLAHDTGHSEQSEESDLTY
jgi:hypothetical protein